MENISFEDQKSVSTKKKKLIWAGVILAIIIASVFGWQYWQYLNSPYYQQLKASKELEKIFSQDEEIGGKTPEETVRLFAEALKKNDIELALKYVSPDPRDREAARKSIEEYKSMKLIDGFIEALINPIKEQDSVTTQFVVNKNGERIFLMQLGKNSKNVWKITKV